MPSVQLFGRKWDTTTDVMPINFFLPALLHVALVIAAIAAVVGRKDTCPDTSAHSAYQALRWGLFGLIVLSAAAELGIVFFGLQGTPLEESKRRLVVPCFYALLILYGIELALVIYGSVILATVRAPCGLDRNARIIIGLSWAKLVFTASWLMSCYFFFPATFDDAQGWMDRLKWIFNQLARLGIRLGQLPGQHGQDGGEDDSDEDKEQHTPKTRDGKEGTREEQLMHQLAATFRMILGDIDLTVTDRHVALVLAGSLQLLRRRRRVARFLLPRERWQEYGVVQGDEEAQEAGLEVARTMLAPSNMASQMRPDLHPAKAAHAYVTGGREAVPPEVLRDALVFLEYSNASYYIEGPMDPEEEWRAREKERRKRRRTCCFVPLPTFMQPERAKRQPTIRRPEEVHPGARLQQARAQSSRTSARAAGKSPAGTPSLSSGSGSDRRKRKRHAPRRAASHAKARAGADGPTHASNGSSDAESGQRTDDSDDDVEAARAESHRQVDGAGDEHDTEKGATGKLDLEDPHKDMDIVYRKADNVVLGQLPYAIALDWKRQNVVLTCRGTSSLRDAVTDAIGQPIDLRLWLSNEHGEPPDEVKGLGPQLAHAGVLTAAAAVYKDLQRHGILEQLLQGSDLPPLPQQTSSQHQPDAGRQGSASQHAKSRPADGQAGPQGSGTASNGGGSSSASSSAGSPPSQPHAASLQDSEARASSGEQGEVPSSAEGASGSHGRLHGSIDERHHAIAETVQEGKDMVARLVQDSNQAGGPQQAGPEARAEEERQLGSLRARKLDCQGWRLVTTGHSLGGGVAALLALKLRSSFPNVKCWAFCPPGGLMTAGLAHAMAPYCTSIALGKDGVPRASLHSMVQLMDDAVEGLARGRRCKARALCRNLYAGGRAKFQHAGEFHALGRIPAEPRAALDRYQKSREQTKHFLGEPTFPAGRVVYVRRLKGRCNRTSYDAVWLPPEALLEEGFLISGRMLKDHLVTAVQEGLEGALDMAEGGAASEQGSEHSHDSDSEGEPRGLVRLCLSCHPRRAARRAAQVRKKREEHVKDGPHASKTGQVAHLSSAVDH